MNTILWQCRRASKMAPPYMTGTAPAATRSCFRLFAPPPQPAGLPGAGQVQDLPHPWWAHRVWFLAKESARLVLEIVESPPEENMYVVLKERLLSSHTLANFQKIKKLHQIDSCSSWPQTLGALAQMLKLCPRRLMRSFSYSCQKVWSLMLTIGVEIVWIARSGSSSRSRRCPPPLLPEDSVICMRICWASRLRNWLPW